MNKKEIEPIYREIGLKLRLARDRTGKTQEEVGNRIDLKKAAISQWESAQNRVYAHNIRDLAQIYGCSADFLLALTEDYEGKKNITREEAEILEAFRTLSDAKRVHLLNTIKMLEGNLDPPTIIGGEK